jgi:Ca2+/Na+ antiporter
VSLPWDAPAVGNGCGNVRVEALVAMTLGVIGVLVGVVGGVVGTAASIRHTAGPKERRFVVRCSALVWSSSAVFLALLFALPPLYRWYVWVLYAILLPIMIVSWSHRRRELRVRDAAERASDTD